MKFWLALAYCPTEELVDLARTADDCGYHGITLSDHLFTARELRAAYPYTADGRPPFGHDTPWPDPWAAISAMGTVSQRVRFTTNMYVAPVRDLFTVAKSVSTAAVLTGGRVAAGFSAGWCFDEFEQTGQDFSTRGERLDEMIGVLRRLWTGEWVEHRGTHFEFPELRISPVPSEPIPVYIGGHSPAALRRAAKIGDGWIGAAYRPEEAERKLAELHAALKREGRAPDGFESVLALIAWPKPELYRRFTDVGLTGTLCAPWMMVDEPTPEKRRASLEQFAEEVIVKT